MAEGAEATCRACGKPVDPQAATCASCGRFVKEAAVQPMLGQLLAGIGGGVAGLVGGFFYSTALLVLLGRLSPSPTPQEVISIKITWWIAALFTIGVMLPLASCYFFGIRLARNGRSVEAALLIGLAIGATFPATACDVGIFSGIGH